jgi:hypothetical protein
VGGRPAAGDPVNFSDPFGLNPCLAGPVAVQVCAAAAFAVGGSIGAVAAQIVANASDGRALSDGIGAAALGGAVAGLSMAAGDAVAGRVMRHAAAAATRFPTKAVRDLAKRGWTRESVRATIRNPHGTARGVYKGNGDPATYYFNEDGSFVVRNDRTRDVIQLSDRKDPSAFKPEIIPDP